MCSLQQDGQAFAHQNTLFFLLGTHAPTSLLSVIRIEGESSSSMTLTNWAWMPIGGVCIRFKNLMMTQMSFLKCSELDLHNLQKPVKLSPSGSVASASDTKNSLIPGSKHDWCKHPLVFVMIASWTFGLAAQCLNLFPLSVQPITSKSLAKFPYYR